jgi:holliday junction DNA helicase RuvB
MTPKDADVLNPSGKAEDEKFDQALRPKSLKEFIGQEKLKSNLLVFIEAARRRKEPLDHCLFYSPPGLGKTTLANILARELGVNLRTAPVPSSSAWATSRPSSPISTRATCFSSTRSIA